MSPLANRVLRFTAVLLAATVLTACSAARDVHEYRSYIHQPKTVTLVDSFSHQAVWTYEVPVNHSLRLRLARPGDVELMKHGWTPATDLNWSVSDAKGHVVNKGEQSLSGGPVRIEVTLRPAPEYPAGYQPPSPVIASAPPETPEAPEPPATPEAPAPVTPATDTPVAAPATEAVPASPVAPAPPATPEVSPAPAPAPAPASAPAKATNTDHPLGVGK